MSQSQEKEYCMILFIWGYLKRSNSWKQRMNIPVVSRGLDIREIWKLLFSGYEVSVKLDEYIHRSAIHHA